MYRKRVTELREQKCLFFPSFRAVGKKKPYIVGKSSNRYKKERAIVYIYIHNYNSVSNGENLFLQMHTLTRTHPPIYICVYIHIYTHTHAHTSTPSFVPFHSKKVELN